VASRVSTGAAHLINRRVAQAGAHADQAAREHSAQAVHRERGAKHLVDLVLEGVSDLVAAKVHHSCNKADEALQRVGPAWHCCFDTSLCRGRGSGVITGTAG
jgi:hypothetical protein